MAQFKNPHDSHQHSLMVLNELYEHDTFMESISTVADMGAGNCLDALWWANAQTRDDSPEPLNLHCYAVDRKPLAVDFDMPSNMTYIKHDFEKRCLPKEVDVIWCHDAFQYALNPLNTIRLFNQQLNVNGMLYIGMPLTTFNINNRINSLSRNFEYYNHNFLSMLYMLAVNGFDCKDAFFRQAKDDDWLHAVVFKTDNEPMDPASTGWYDLLDRDLLHPSIVQSLRQFGLVREQDALYSWLDRNFYRING
jgi:hypothetical protein